MVCRIKNISGEIKELYIKEFQVDDIYTIPDIERYGWSFNNDVILSISNSQFQIYDNDTIITNISDQIAFLQKTNTSPKASDSTPYVRVTEKTVGKFLQLYGLEITCPKNQTTNHDIKWTVDLEFVGARAIDEKNIKGNYANMQLIDIDNILGYGAGFVLHEFGKNISSALLHAGCNVETTTAATINAGLYIRIQYINNSDEDTTLNAALKYYV